MPGNAPMDQPDRAYNRYGGLMRMAVIVGLLMSVVVSASDSGAAGAQRLDTPPAGGVNGRGSMPNAVAPAPPGKPFANLFGSPLQRNPTSRLLPLFQASPVVPPESSTKPFVVCGMTLVPVDPNLDAAIRHTVPRGGVRWTIRAVPPPACER